MQLLQTTFLFLSNRSAQSVQLRRLATGEASFKQFLFTWLGAFVLALQVCTSQAQSALTDQQDITEQDSTRGYWRLKTQADTRSTRIQFFGRSGQLLYEETLPEKWVKLTPKNQKQFDQLLAQLVDGHLLTSRIKTEPLPASLVEPASIRRATRLATDQSVGSTSASYQVRAYANQAGKLYVVIDNPEQLRYSIKVADQSGRALYQEFANHSEYRRKLDISAIDATPLQLIVQIDKKPFVYAVKRQSNKVNYRIQPLSAGNPQPPAEQNGQDNKPALVPVNISL